jgi:adenylate cyclase
MGRVGGASPSTLLLLGVECPPESSTMATPRHGRIERRLAAILAADVAGYSRLTGLDEEGTHAQLQDHLRSLVDPKITENRGRVVKNTGDGLLAEFNSVVDAVRCAVEVQRRMVERNVDVPTERRIEFRIGINVGDVMIDGGDIFGDGVNVAARLEAVAEPGGICISDDAYRQVRNKLDVTFKDAGERQLKNIALPVRVFRVVAIDDARTTKAIWPRHDAVLAVHRERWSARITAIGAAVARIAGTAGTALYSHLSRAPVVSQLPGQLAKLSERLSIVVLPFANLSGDASQDYLADVITDELTTGISRIRDSFVISRSTAFTYKSKPIDVRQIAKDLDVRYLLEGSVQPSGDRLRVHAQLIDAGNDTHLWADQFDENRSDLFQMQDAIVARIAHAVGIKMTVERARWAQTRAAIPNAEDLAWRGAAALMRTFYTHESDTGYELCEQALQIDPENVRALSWLSFKFSRRVITLASTDRQADLHRAHDLASLAIKIDPDFCLGHSAKGDVLLLEGRHRGAIDAYQRALMLAPSSIQPGLAIAYNYVGEAEQAISYADKAMRLSPHDPFLFHVYNAKAMAFGILQDYEEALLWLQRAEAAVPDNPLNVLARAGVLAMAGREADARATMQRYLANENTPIRTIAQWQSVQLPADSPRFLISRQKFIEGLRKAGLPERSHACPTT